MRSRKPSKNILKHSITLWNWTNRNEIVHGAPVVKYNRVFIDNVIFDGSEQMYGAAQLGDVYIEIYNGVSEAYNESGAVCRYVEPYVYVNASAEEQKTLWTLNKDNDFISRGRVSDNMSVGGEKNRTDFKIRVADAKYDLDGSVHHWEVFGI